MPNKGNYYESQSEKATIRVKEGQVPLTPAGMNDVGWKKADAIS